ncbi:MAG: hypothetical protein ACREHC_02140 [Candidatus Levyibacteriota bacterium]
MKSYIRFVELKRWLRAYDKGNPLLNSRVISDIRVDMQNCTSIYALSEDGSNSAKIILAFAENRRGVERIDYVKIDEDELDKLAFSANKNPSNVSTKIKNVNNSHYDLKVGQVDKLIQLAEFIYKKTLNINGLDPGDVIKLFEDEIKSGELSMSDLNEDIQKAIKKYQS